jgi:hypothetical protein
MDKGLIERTDATRLSACLSISGNAQSTTCITNLARGRQLPISTGSARLIRGLDMVASCICTRSGMMRCLGRCG